MPVTNRPTGPEPVCATPEVSVRRTAFHLESRGSTLFACLHRPEGPTWPGYGVVICPTIGCEQIHTNRAIRHLADKLARAGLPTLRFDFHGTGDSAGTDEEPDRLATWLGNIADAHRWMRRQVGDGRVSLVGVRLGAFLLLHAEFDQDPEDIVLWAPVNNGRAYVREMTALSLTSAMPQRNRLVGPDDIEAGGFILKKATVEDLTRLDLPTRLPACRRALVVNRDDMPPKARLVDHLQRLGAPVEQTSQPGFAEMMTVPHESLVPWQALSEITDWLLPPIPLTFDPNGDTSPVLDFPREAIIPEGGNPNDPTSTPHRISEQLCSISEDPRLFGIVSEPERGEPGNRPTVVLLNAGSTHRVGPSRLNVFLARRLASLGFRCLRMDLHGLGDSVRSNSETDPEAQTNPHPATMPRDIELTLAWLKSEFGANRVILMGLCSGATAAFHSAAENVDPVLVESILINPVTFYWDKWMSTEGTPLNVIKDTHYYLTSAIQPHKWMKLLSRKTEIGFGGALRLLMTRFRTNRLPAARPDLGGIDDGHAMRRSHPERKDVRDSLDFVAKSGRKLTFFFADSEPGYSILMSLARQKVKKLMRSKIVQIRFIKNADHTFTKRLPRLELVQAVADHLVRSYQ